MNILYLGPYKQKTVLGLTSQIIVLNLLNSKKVKVSCIPLFLDFNKITPEENIHKSIIESQNNHFNDYDCVIQHVPIASATPIDAVSKNILLPIISSSDYKIDINALKRFDKILVDNPKDYKKLSEYKQIKNKISVYDYSVSFSSNDESKIDLGIINFYKKLYYVGDYSTNKDNIHKLCNSFASHSKRDQHTLLLFLSYLTKPQKDEIESYIHKIHQLCNKNLPPKINVIGIDTDMGTLSLIHRTGDVFIDLNDDCTNTLNTKISKIYNKSLLTFDINDYEFKYENNGKFYLDGFSVVSEESISDKISKYLYNNTVDNISHTKKTDINELI
jgi:hypothetical protein